MIHPDCVETIIDKARVEEVIGDFISLKKSGSNYKGCCPFHNEKTPSFMVSPAKGIYKCFGCSKGGNAVSFVMDHERLSYVDALKYLAKKYNIDVIETEISEEDKQRKDIRESLQVINTFASNYFVDNLHNHEFGKAVGLSYFKERGFTDETIKQFQLGYSLDVRDAFSKEALSKGYKLEYLTQVGLTIVGEDQKGAGYKADRFRGRVMFPIHSLTGSVIGFGGRIVGADPEKKLAKYVNSPESEIYNKSKTLYGIYFARTEITKKNECILVEGYTDVMSMHQSGIINTVASSGTSLTEEQIHLIKRFTDNILVIYDGDSAGIKASFRGINMILEQGLHVKVLLLPDGDDPDSFAKKHDAKYLQDYIDMHKADFVTFKTKLFAEDSKDDPIERAKLINDIVHTIAVVPDKIEQTVYLKKCSEILKIDESILEEQLLKIKSVQQSKSKEVQTNQAKQKPLQTQQFEPVVIDNKYESNERELIRLLLLYGQEVEDFPGYESPMLIRDFLYKEIVDGEMYFIDETYKYIFKEYYEYVSKNEGNIDRIMYTDNSKINQIFADVYADSEKKRISPLFSKKGGVEVETEQKNLSVLVFETVTRYKQKRIKKDIEAFKTRLKNTEMPPQEMTEILMKISELTKRKVEINKELKHVS